MRSAQLSCWMIWTTPRWRTTQSPLVSSTASSRTVWEIRHWDKSVVTLDSSCPSRPRSSRARLRLGQVSSHRPGSSSEVFILSSITSLNSFLLTIALLWLKNVECDTIQTSLIVNSKEQSLWLTTDPTEHTKFIRSSGTWTLKTISLTTVTRELEPIWLTTSALPTMLPSEQFISLCSKFVKNDKTFIFHRNSALLLESQPKFVRASVSWLTFVRACSRSHQNVSVVSRTSTDSSPTQRKSRIGTWTSIWNLIPLKRVSWSVLRFINQFIQIVQDQQLLTISNPLDLLTTQRSLVRSYTNQFISRSGLSSVWRKM